MKIKEEYLINKRKLRSDIMNLIYKFNEETGLKVIHISSDIGFDVLSIDISTDIDKE